MSDSAWQEAGRLLGRRPLTEEELRERLLAGGHAADAVQETLERLRARGWLDDRRLAFDFVVERARKGYGRERLMAELARRGVASALAEAAWHDALAGGAVDPDDDLRRELERRLGGRSRLDERALSRVYNALLRAGFESSAIRRQLAPHLERSSRPEAGDAYDELP